MCLSLQVGSLLGALSPSRRTIVVELPGHGDAPFATPAAMQAFADDLGGGSMPRALAAHVERVVAHALPAARRVDVVGFSLGGQVGARRGAASSSCAAG